MKNISFAKKFALAAFVILSTSFAWAQYPIEGAWGMVQTQNGFVMDMTLTVRNNTVSILNVCNYQGVSAQALATAPAVYDQQTMTVQAADSDQQTNGGLTCNADLRPMQMNYIVQGNQITFTMQGSNDQFTLTRRSN